MNWQMIPSDPEIIIEWMSSLPPVGIYIFLTFSAFMENIFPPWPSDVLSVFAGFLSARGVLAFHWSLISGILGNMLGSMLMFYLGYLFQKRIRRAREDGKVHPILRRMRFLSREKMDKAHEWIVKYGLLFVIVSRFISGIRFFVSIFAGVTEMNFILFLLAFFLGVVIWSSLLVTGGYLLGDNWEEVLGWVTLYNKIVLVLLAASVIMYLGYRWRARISG